MVVMAAQLKEFGWQYVVVDEGWYLENPENASIPEALRHTINSRGQYDPAPNRFPTSEFGGGVKPLRGAVHQHGLKLGMHTIHRVPEKTGLAHTHRRSTQIFAAVC